MEEGIDYYFYNVIPPRIRQAVKDRCRHKPKPKPRKEIFAAPKMYMEDIEVLDALNEYGRLSFEQLPEWLKQELRARNLNFPTRKAENYEVNVTKRDLREHRVTNNELSINDYNELLKKGMKYHV